MNAYSAGNWDLIPSDMHVLKSRCPERFQRIHVTPILILHISIYILLLSSNSSISQNSKDMYDQVSLQSHLGQRQVTKYNELPVSPTLIQHLTGIA